jgi:hypothetical protein
MLAVRGRSGSADRCDGVAAARILPLIGSREAGRATDADSLIAAPGSPASDTDT